MRALLIAMVWMIPVFARAQTTLPDGLYEAWSALAMEPVGPLSGPPPHLERWIEVHTESSVTTVTFEPERRVQWTITLGANGPIEKRIEVDGESYATSRFEYDAAGHLARKTVFGPAVTGN